MLLESEGFQNGEILWKYGCKSDVVEQGVPVISFPLRWTSVPAETKSFALTFLDYDNIPDEGFCWIHWLVADIPKQIHYLSENESRINPKLIQGRNSWAAPFEPYNLPPSLTDFYGGPAPSLTHEYEVNLFALDTFLELKNGFYYNSMRKLMQGHVLDVAILKGIYKI